MKILQFGRSMIEMLGVLAIIGVMSIGGIAGYRIAMNKYQANVILEDVNRFAFTIVERSPLPDGEISPADFVQTTPYTVTATNDVEGDYFYIDVHGVPKGVCKEVLNKKSNDFEIYAGTQGNYLYQGDDDICDDTNLVTFYFGDTDGLCSHTPGQNEEACAHGCVCDGACLNDVKTGEKVCCESGTQEACGGNCLDFACAGSDMRFDTTTCQCICDDPMKTYDAAHDKCVCKTSGSNVALVEDSNGNCGCADNTYTWVDSMNKCSKLTCDSYCCSLDGTRCGCYCSNKTDPHAIACTLGACRSEACTINGRTLERKYIPGGYGWGCRLPNTNCYQRESDHFYCYNETGLCCFSDDQGVCLTGLCDKSYCTGLKDGNGSSATFVVYDEWRGSCKFAKENVTCFPTGSSKSAWTCVTASGVTCATDCATPPNCGTCNDPCGGQGTADGDYCCVTHGTDTICKKGNNFYFKNGNTYNQCGYGCTYSGLTKQNDESYTISSVSCTLGDCQAITCNTSAGWSYGKITSTDYNAIGWLPSVFGCVKGNIGCYTAKNGYGPVSCTCGNYCSQNDTTGGCQTYSMKQCAPSVTREVNGVSVTKPACIYGRVQGTIDVDDYDYDCWCQGDVDEATNICCDVGQVVRGGKCVIQQ